MTRAHVVTALERGEGSAAGALLARAFLQNPGYLAALGFLDDARRLTALTSLKTGFVRAALRSQRAEAVHVDGALAGVAVIADPGQYPHGVVAFLDHARGALATGPRGIRNLLVLDSVIRRAHPKQPHHYLFVLGVDPPFQGRGVGRALLDALAARADSDRLPCYLETDTEANVRFYRSAGYEVGEELHVARLGNLRMWGMLRPSRG